MFSVVRLSDNNNIFGVLAFVVAVAACLFLVRRTFILSVTERPTSVLGGDRTGWHRPLSTVLATFILTLCRSHGGL